MPASSKQAQMGPARNRPFVDCDAPVPVSDRWTRCVVSNERPS